eukprot:1489747-Rhodomonas_salina.2
MPVLSGQPGEALGWRRAQQHWHWHCDEGWDAGPGLGCVGPVRPGRGLQIALLPVREASGLRRRDSEKANLKR